MAANLKLINVTRISTQMAAVHYQRSPKERYQMRKPGKDTLKYRKNTEELAYLVIPLFLWTEMEDKAASMTTMKHCGLLIQIIAISFKNLDIAKKIKMKKFLKSGLHARV